MTVQNTSTRFAPLLQELLKHFGRDVSDEDLKLLIFNFDTVYFTVSANDKHFQILKDIGFPRVNINSIEDFIYLLNQEQNEM